MNIIDTYLTEMAQLKSASTVKNHKSTLNKFFSEVNVTEIIEVLPTDVMKFKKQVLAKGTVASMNTQLKRLKAFFKWCVNMGVMDFSPAEDIGLEAEAQAVPKWLTEEQENALIRAVKRDYLGINVADNKKSYRELLMVMLMLKAGLRVGELVGQKLSDIRISERKATLYVRAEKTNQHREVPLTSDVLKLMKAYLESHTPKGDYLFDSRQSQQVTERMVQKILKKYDGLKTETAIIEHVTPHMLRHTYAHNLAKGGMAIESIARLMGHFKENGQPNIQQTIRYTMKSNAEIFDEVENILAIK